MEPSARPAVVELSSKKFLAWCAVLAGALVWWGARSPLPAWLIACEVFAAIIALFVFGSIRYRLDKNALTYGAGLVISATFWSGWWPGSALKASMEAEGGAALWRFARHHGLSLHGLDQLVHADTMLFILGLTFFVAVIAQTRILESLSFRLLARNRGGVVPTVAMIAFVVSFASGILDGVSMIGLMIRTLVIILFLAKVTGDSVVYSVMVSTVCTTVCGMWLAYGEPPNLIMKANLFPYLDNAFFLRYCLPVALASYGVVFFNVSRKLKGRRVDTAKLDILDLHTADVRFLQASRHGEVLTPVGFVEDHPGEFGERLHPVLDRLHRGEPLGQAMIAEGIDPDARRRLLGHFVWEPLAETLDRHYEHAAKGGPQSRDESAAAIKAILAEARKGRVRSQLIGGISFVPFIGFLVWHALDHHVPLFAASFAGFAVALFGIIGIRAMRRLALREAAHEYSEYLFLFPLFFSIALLQKAGFFEAIARALLLGVEKFGAAHMAAFQFAGATFLSAMLDNNVVADFAGRAIHGLGAGLIHLFAMAQIAGYAVGGCWTHIGSAQSVVAYAFIRKEIDERYNPFQWIRAMTPVILEIFVLAVVIVYIEGFLYGSR